MSKRKIAIIGLGYVGLTLANGLARKTTIIGFDKSETRIAELQKGYDHNYELGEAELSKLDIRFTADEKDLDSADFFIITVPTPVNAMKQPDLSYIVGASQLVGRHLKPKDIVVYESTVYPGATEEVGLPALEETSHLKAGTDFTLGYSPERINPGDTQHTLSNTIKIISAQDAATLDVLDEVYSMATDAGVYRAPTMKVAEAAKVIENTQRDLNISLINELAFIFHRLNIDTIEVLKAAETKWNFLSFRPGLVGGHCIGVDPYYLTYKAQQVGYDPNVILAGRRINDTMGKFIAERTIKNLIRIGVPIKHCRIAVLGITFKENCADTRNSRVIDLIHELRSYGTEVLVHDPVANPVLVKEEYGIELQPWEKIVDIEAIILAVAHQKYLELDKDVLQSKLNHRGLMMDVKSILNPHDFKGSGIIYWRL